MASFRTIVDVPQQDDRIKTGYEDTTLWMGSCFAENIGGKMKRMKFPAEVNPFGVIYNPVSVGNSLRILLEKRFFTKDHLNYHNGRWYSFNHHTSFSSTDADKCLERINRSTEKGSEALKKSGYLFITFGTARVYEFRETGEVVSNCHKLPAKNFDRYLLSIEEIVERYKKLFEKLRLFNPGINIVLTVSPVRHWKDGPAGNQVSKSVLILAVQKLIEMFGFVQYFPAYEIVMDDLRDYRFYEKDMLHINSQAIEYIWEKFSTTFILHEAHLVMREVEKILQGLGHKPFDPSSESYRDFLQQIERQIMEIEKKYPFIDFTDELKALSGI